MQRIVRCLLAISMVTGLQLVLWPSRGMAQAVTGSGATNYVTKWTNGSGSVIGNANIYVTGGDVGIGTTTPAAKLEVNGDTQVDNNLYIGGAIYTGSESANFVVLQIIGDNFGVGSQALGTVVTGGANTAVGDGTLGVITSGSDNTVVGYGAGGNITTGAGNTGVGFSALDADTTGAENTAVGKSAGQAVTTGGENTAVGYQALLLNSTSSSNTAVGTAALENTTAGFNTAVGGGAGENITSGASNIAVGYGAGGSLTTGSNNIYLGNAGTSTESGVTRIGTAGTQTSAYFSGIYGVTTGTNNAVAVLVDSNGNLGTVSSSRRYKEDINDMGDASSGVLALRPVTFRYKRPFEDGSKPIQYGLIAEEVAAVYPDLVTRTADGQVESVKYHLLAPMLINELQKQHATILSQKEEIRLLEERLARVERLTERSAITASLIAPVK